MDELLLKYFPIIFEIVGMLGVFVYAIVVFAKRLEFFLMIIGMMPIAGLFKVIFEKSLILFYLSILVLIFIIYYVILRLGLF